MQLIALFALAQVLAALSDDSMDEMLALAERNVPYVEACDDFDKSLGGPHATWAALTLTEAHRVLTALSVFPGVSPIEQRVHRWLLDSEATPQEQQAVVERLAAGCRIFDYLDAAQALLSTAEAHGDAQIFRAELAQVLQNNAARDLRGAVPALRTMVHAVILDRAIQIGLFEAPDLAPMLRHLIAERHAVTAAVSSRDGEVRADLAALDDSRQAIMSQLSQMY